MIQIGRFPGCTVCQLHMDQTLVKLVSDQVDRITFMGVVYCVTKMRMYVICDRIWVHLESPSFGLLSSFVKGK